MTADANVAVSIVGDGPLKTNGFNNRMALGNDDELQALLKKFEKLLETFNGLDLGSDIQNELQMAIPVVAVVGHQSHGKSSLLSMVSGVVLPIGGQETVTTRPLKLKLRKGSQSSAGLKFRFKSHEDPRCKDVEIGEKDVYAAIKQAMFQNADKSENRSIRKEMMVLTVEGSPIDIDLVDLPGMKFKPPEESASVSELIHEWLDPQRAAIIIIVHSAAEDFDNDKVYTDSMNLRTGYELADRTLCVLTKADTVVEADGQSKAQKLLKLLSDQSSTFRRACVISDIPTDTGFLEDGLSRIQRALDNEAGKLAELKRELDEESRTKYSTYMGTQAVRNLITQMYIKAARQQEARLKELVRKRLAEISQRESDLNMNQSAQSRFRVLYSPFLTHVNDTIRARDDKTEAQLLNCNPQAAVFKVCNEQLQKLEMVPNNLLHVKDPVLKDFVELFTDKAGLEGLLNYNQNNRLSRFNEKLIEAHLRPALGEVCRVVEQELKRAVGISLDTVPDTSIRAYMESAAKEVVAALVGRIKTRVEDIFQDQRQSAHTTDKRIFRFYFHVGRSVEKCKQFDLNISDCIPTSEAVWTEFSTRNPQDIPPSRVDDLTYCFDKFCTYWLMMIHTCMDAVSMCVRRELLSLHDWLNKHPFDDQEIENVMCNDAGQRELLKRTKKALEEARSILGGSAMF